MPKGFNLLCVRKNRASWLQSKGGARSRPDRPWCSYLYRRVKPMTHQLPIAPPAPGADR
jgi:hypothetical protein